MRQSEEKRKTVKKRKQIRRDDREGKGDEVELRTAAES